MTRGAFGDGRAVLGLYLVTDPDVAAGRDLVATVEAAVDGGVSCVQVRDKRADGRALVALTRALVTRLRPRGVPVIVNDRLDVALIAGADGLHIGQSDLHPDDVRRWTPPGFLLGLSVECLDDVRAAEALPVDYLGVSPVFATPTKTDTATPFGLEGLAAARRLTRRPLVAIGGVQLHNAARVLAAGADGLAVVSAILAAPSPREAASALRAAVQSRQTEESRT